MKTIFSCVTNLSTPEAQQSIREAGCVIRNGGLVIFPTETVYGLGGNATSDGAAAAIYAAKGRPADNPLIIHIANPWDAYQYTYPTPVYDLLAAAFMPGPLTVIMKAKENIPLTVRAGLETVAVRCPSHPVAQALIRAAEVPIAAPSANLSGKPSPTCASHVRDDMDGRVDIILDGGESEVGLESTIVKIEEDGSLILLRPGAITLRDLQSVVPNVAVASAVTAMLSEGEKVLSPGMKYRHYAPASQVYLLNGDVISKQKYISKRLKSRCAVLCYKEEVPYFKDIFSPEDIYILGEKNDLRTQAHRLFYLLREADKTVYDAIYAPLPPKEGIGLALYNRMIRAAAYNIIDL